MGVQEMALMLLGIGILSEKFGGGKGLISLGTGVQALVAAPLMGTGTGLSSLAGGLRDIATSFGDIGRGISDLLGSFQGLPGYVGPGGSGSGLLPQPGAALPGNGNGNGPPLIAMSGDGGASLYTGGGANVPAGVSFSFVEPSAFIKSSYAVTSGYHAGLGVPGWWVSNSPIQSSPAGGGSLL